MLTFIFTYLFVVYFNFAMDFEFVNNKTVVFRASPKLRILYPIFKKKQVILEFYHEPIIRRQILLN